MDAYDKAILNEWMERELLKAQELTKKILVKFKELMKPREKGLTTREELYLTWECMNEIAPDFIKAADLFVGVNIVEMVTELEREVWDEICGHMGC